MPKVYSKLTLIGRLILSGALGSLIPSAELKRECVDRLCRSGTAKIIRTNG